MTRTLARLKDDAHETLRIVLREAALRDPWTFLTEVLFHPEIVCDDGKCCDKKRGFYEPIHKPWLEFANDISIPRKLLLAPRGHFKSTVVSYGTTVLSILRNPNIRILLISALEQNASNFCMQVKGAFQYNQRLAWCFPEAHVEPGQQFGPTHSFIIPSRTDRTLAAPTVTSAYIDAALASQHYDRIIMDDPIEAKHVATEEQAVKARSSYNKIIPLLDPPTEGNLTDLTVIGTRWAFFDLYSTMATEDLGGVATSTTFKCIVKSAFENSDHKSDFEHGDPIFPTRFSRETLLGLLDEYRGDLTLGEQSWWNQYMNLCRTPDSAPFQDSWFIETPSEGIPPLFAKMIVVDTALKDDVISKKGARGDFTTIMVGGWDREGRLYHLDGMKSNAWTSKEFTDILVTFAQKYGIATVVKQKISEDTLGTVLRDAFAAVHLPIDYKPIIVQGMGRKVQRIKDALQEPMQRQAIFFVKRQLPNGLWEHHRLLDAAKKELTNLGQYPTDDVADCMANFFHPDVRVRRQNLVGNGQNNWKVPGAVVQLSTQPRQQQMQARPGQSGYVSNWAVPKRLGVGSES